MTDEAPVPWLIAHCGPLVGVSDIATRYGVSRQAVHQWIARPGFPAPVGWASGARVWLFGDVQDWREGRRA